VIWSVSGQVAHVGLDHVVLESSGVGYRVNATPATCASLAVGSQARLLTTLIVREDAMTLYGFADSAARELFALLLTVSGVGPKLALAALAVHDPASLRNALAQSDSAALTRVPGVGKRVAERLIVELRDKAAALPGGEAPTHAKAAAGVRDAVVEALVGLGFTAKQAESATDSALADNPGGLTSATLRSALALLGGK
jgi:Holliday junction DNA helicase RuvA